MMKATGIIRKIDELGRIVVPKELRKAMNIKEGDGLEIFVENETIILKKYNYSQDITDVLEELRASVSSMLNFGCKQEVLDELTKIKSMLASEASA